MAAIRRNKNGTATSANFKLDAPAYPNDGRRRLLEARNIGRGVFGVSEANSGVRALWGHLVHPDSPPKSSQNTPLRDTGVFLHQPENGGFPRVQFPETAPTTKVGLQASPIKTCAGADRCDCT